MSYSIYLVHSPLIGLLNQSERSVLGRSSPLLAPPAQPGGDRETAQIYTRWWFWTGVGAVVVGAVIAGVVIATRGEVGDCQGINPCRTVGD